MIKENRGLYVFYGPFPFPLLFPGLVWLVLVWLFVCGPLVWFLNGFGPLITWFRIFPLSFPVMFPIPIWVAWLITFLIWFFLRFWKVFMVSNLCSMVMFCCM